MENQKHKILTSQIKAILSLSPRAIEIMRKQKMMNLRLVEKSSKSKKDPSPLVTAMTTMGLKYPIVIDKEKAKEYGVPSKYMLEGKGEDYQIHGRVLCKKEVIDWWVENSELPNEDIIKVIDTLYKNSRHEVSTYYSVKWERSRIKFGQPVLERRNVLTRNVLP